MNITELLKESFQPEQASLIESAIAQAIEAQVEIKLAEAKADSATAQAQVAQKSAEDIENISATYDSEMKKAAKEIVKLENNLGFFGKVSRDNPLLKDTFDKIADKKAQLEMLKQSLHHIISGE